MTVTVESGGAIINDGGFAITCLEALQHDNTLDTTNDGGLIKIGGGTLTLAEANTYTGPTVVSNGTLALTGAGSVSGSAQVWVALGATLDASGAVNQTLTLNSGQTLAGSGMVKGGLIGGPGSIVAPGANGSATGVLTVSSNVTLEGAALLKLNPAAQTNDVLQAYGITYGGTLTLSNISGTGLAAGNVFELFAATNRNGSFAALDPPLPAPGLRWNTNNLAANGTVGVILAPQPGIVGASLAGTNLVINATNGSGGGTYTLLMSTNVALPLSKWAPVVTNVLGASGNFSVTATNAVGSGATGQFYLLRVQ